MTKKTDTKAKKTFATKKASLKNKRLQKGNYIVHDKYFQKAKREGYRTRSVYKLLEIQKKFNLIKPNFSVIDIGAAPGGFLQVIGSIVKDNLIVGVDLKEIKPLSFKNIKTITCDILDQEKLALELEKILPKNHLFDLIVSDVAPNTTGVFEVDQYASVELNIAICKLSDRFLKKGGNMILKVFKGEDFGELLLQIKKRFSKLKAYKPRACRDSSCEEYLICFGKK